MEKFQLGPYLKELRLKKKLSIRKLEELSGVSNSYISQMEKGQRKPSPEVLFKLTKPLDVSHVHLMYRAGYLPNEDFLETDLEEKIYRQEFEEQMAELRRKITEKKDLKNILTLSDLTYKSVPLTTLDKKLINVYLDTLTEDRKKED